MSAQTAKTELSMIQTAVKASQTLPLPPAPPPRAIMRSPLGMDVEPMETVMEEISAALSLHCRHQTRDCCQKPIMTLRGLSMSGVE
eukprot:4266955-Pleurochrysis_carterae.AAC.1